MLKKNEDNDWKKVHNPAEIIEEVLPSALSQYFFFDGESMIADLNVKGKDSAKTLRSALYSIFDMDIYEQAKQHIGDTSLQQTVLGKLYLEKSEGSTDSAVIIAKGELRQAQTRLQACRDEALALNRRRDELRARIAELSEKIGSTKSRQELESRRKDEKANIAKWTEFIKKEQLAFGADVSTLYPYLLASQVIKHAQERIGLKVGEVCLYGHSAFGYKTFGKFYQKLIYNLINNEAKLNESESAYCKLVFSHIDGNEEVLYSVCRSWSWKASTIREQLTVEKNGVTLANDSLANFQKYLLHLIPPDMLRLYFFDGEKIADYFLGSKELNIRDALMVLSGNDTFDAKITMLMLNYGQFYRNSD